MNLNGTNDKGFLNTVAAVVKGMIAKNAGAHVPNVQVTTPSTAPNQISTIQGIPPTNQIIIVQPPAPQIVFSDGRFESGPREYFGKLYTLETLYYNGDGFRFGKKNFKSFQIILINANHLIVRIPNQQFHHLNKILIKTKARNIQCRMYNQPFWWKYISA